MLEFWKSFTDGLLATSWPEAIAVITGILSVWYSKQENVLVYPVGLINNIIYIYLSFSVQLFGEGLVNSYYAVMSIYGWMLWLRRNPTNQAPAIRIAFSDRRGWIEQLLFFLFFFIALYLALLSLKKDFAPNAIPLADAFASATAFTGMWLMARKKVESWYWWVATNITSIPLYYIKGFAFTSVYYVILLVFALFGLAAWKQKAKVS